MKDVRYDPLPKGAGYIIGFAIGMPMFVVFGMLMDNFALGFACLISGYAIGLALESHKPQHLTVKQKKIAVVSMISGIIVLAVFIVLFTLA